VPPLRALRNRCNDASVRLSRLLAAAGSALLLACATARTPSTPHETPLAARVQAEGLLFEVLYTAADAAEIPRIEQGLLAAGARVGRWGAFRAGVSVHVFPDHGSLEEAVERRGYPWLRAWAFGDQLLLQSPRSWNPGAGANDAEVAELIAHEVTHALMYQLMHSSDDAAWAAEEPPLWFREGMASVTAGQEHRRPSSVELSRWAQQHPGADLLRPPPELYRTEKDAVYGAAHRAFELLLQVTGEDAVREVLRRVSAGSGFAEAFKAATGLALDDFEREAIRSGFNPAAIRLAGTSAAGAP
jgi:hypothetical protein